MKNKFVIVPVIFILINVSVFSQSNYSKSFIISLNSGGFLISRKNFSETYNSKLGPTFGFGLGATLSDKINLFGKATYFSKNGIPSISILNTDNTGHSTIVTQKSDGTASFKEWLINVGLQYNLNLSKGLLLGMNGGLTFVYAKEVHNDKTGKNILNSNASGLWGFFMGAGMEKRFGKSPFSLFMECQYNFNLYDFFELYTGFGGVNISIGSRVYIRR